MEKAENFRAHWVDADEKRLIDLKRNLLKLKIFRAGG